MQILVTSSIIGSVLYEHEIILVRIRERQMPVRLDLPYHDHFRVVHADPTTTTTTAEPGYCHMLYAVLLEPVTPLSLQLSRYAEDFAAIGRKNGQRNASGRPCAMDVPSARQIRL